MRRKIHYPFHSIRGYPLSISPFGEFPEATVAGAKEPTEESEAVSSSSMYVWIAGGLALAGVLGFAGFWLSWRSRV